LARAGRVDGESEVVGVKFHPFVSEGLDAVAVGGKGGATVVAFGVDGSEFVAFAQGEAIVGTVSASVPETDASVEVRVATVGAFEDVRLVLFIVKSRVRALVGVGSLHGAEAHGITVEVGDESASYFFGLASLAQNFASGLGEHDAILSASERVEVGTVDVAPHSALLGFRQGDILANLAVFRVNIVTVSLETRSTDG